MNEAKPIQEGSTSSGEEGRENRQNRSSDGTEKTGECREEERQTVARSKGGNRKTGGNGEGQGIERKTNRQKRGELHGVLEAVIARETRQQRLREGNASPADAHAEAEAIEADARARSGRIRQAATTTN